MDEKNILEYYFGSKPKYALVVTMAISKKQRKTHQQQQKKNPQVWKQLAMYELFLWSQTPHSNQFTEYKWSNWGQSLSEGPKIY